MTIPGSEALVEVRLDPAEEWVAGARIEKPHLAFDAAERSEVLRDPLRCLEYGCSLVCEITCVQPIDRYARIELLQNPAFVPRELDPRRIPHEIRSNPLPATNAYAKESPAPSAAAGFT